MSNSAGNDPYAKKLDRIYNELIKIRRRQLKQAAAVNELMVKKLDALEDKMIQEEEERGL
jgi:hypothetical protein